MSEIDLNLGIPKSSDLIILPDTAPILLRRMPVFNFEHGLSAENISNTMIEMMIAHGGIGLAANQIGFELRAFSMIRNGVRETMFNPTLSELSAETHKMKEGCLSFPSLYLNVNRPMACRLNYQDVRGDRFSVVLEGIEARCAMHEIDHLNGVLFTSKVSKLHLTMQVKKLKKKR